MKHLFNMKMIEGGFVTNHLNEFNTITSQLSSMGINFDEEIRALLILCSFPKSYNDLVMVVSNSTSGSNALKYDDVIGVILSEETHKKTSSGSTSRSALNAQSRGRMTKRKTILEIMGNQEESRRERGLNPEDKEIFGIVVNQGIRRKIVGLKRIIKEINHKGTRRKIW